MAENYETREMAHLSSTDNPSPSDRSEASACRRGMTACGMGHKGLKGVLMMAACCGAPLLIWLVLPLTGSVLGSFGISALQTLAFLACPVGIGFMMWMIMRAQRVEVDQPAPIQPDSLDAAAPARVTHQDV